MCPRARDLITTGWVKVGRNNYKTMMKHTGQGIGQILKVGKHIRIYSFLSGTTLSDIPKMIGKRFNYRSYIPVWEKLMDAQLETIFRNDKRKSKSLH